MADQRGGGITWTNETWNPIRGCRRVSDECLHCYAERTAGRFCGPGQAYHGIAVNTPSGPRWTGTIKLIEDHLEDPLRWQRPRMIFVNSMSDIFYEDLPDAQIDQIAAVMVLADRHTFQPLTKRYERMAEYLTNPLTPGRIAEACLAVTHHSALGLSVKHVHRTAGEGGRPKLVTWPIPNVWWGFSAGRQKTFDQAMPHVQRIRPHTAVTWWSAEPMLERIDVNPPANRTDHSTTDTWLAFIDWVVAGGESQDGCRPFDPEWARELKYRSAWRAGGPAAFHMKQLGGDPDPRKKLEDLPPDLQVREYPSTAAGRR